MDAVAVGHMQPPPASGLCPRPNHDATSKLQHDQYYDFAKVVQLQWLDLAHRPQNELRFHLAHPIHLQQQCFALE